MITSAEQHERLKQECFKAACPALWLLLMYPYEDVRPIKIVTKTKQRRALEELRRLLPNLIPQRLMLDDEEQTSTRAGDAQVR
jgi:hypothetical protein